MPWNKVCKWGSFIGGGLPNLACGITTSQPLSHRVWFSGWSDDVAAVIPLFALFLSLFDCFTISSSAYSTIWPLENVIILDLPRQTVISQMTKVTRHFFFSTWKQRDSLITAQINSNSQMNIFLITFSMEKSFLMIHSLCWAKFLSCIWKSTMISSVRFQESARHASLDQRTTLVST